MSGDVQRIEEVEARFAQQIEKLTDTIASLNNAVTTMSANATANEKVNDFKIKALERLFDRADKTDIEIDDIKERHAEMQGGINVFKWIAGMLGIPGVLAFLKGFFG